MSSRFIILTLSTALLGLILLFTFVVSQDQLPPWLGSLIQEMASVLIISGTVSAISGLYTTQEFVGRLSKTEEHIKNSLLTNDRLKRLGNVGIVDAYADATRYDFTSFIENAHKLTLCLNDGKSWLSNNLNALRKHMSAIKSETTLVLVDPDGEYVKVLAQRTNQDMSYQANKIRDTCHRLIDLHQSLENSNNRVVKIFFHDLPSVHSIFLSEDFAIISEYTTSRPRIAVPLLIAASSGQDSYYHFIRTDVGNLISDSQCTKLMFHAEDGNIVVNRF